MFPLKTRCSKTWIIVSGRPPSARQNHRRHRVQRCWEIRSKKTATKPSVKGRHYLEFLMIRLTPHSPPIVEILAQNIINERDTCMLMVLKCVSIKSDTREPEIFHKPALLADLKAVGLWKSGRNMAFLDDRVVNLDATSYSPLYSTIFRSIKLMKNK